ncbi:MAG: PHP domain-containing protein [Candidatus Aenigmarchaeota archaeon]|nr:PHP domain-containing protein [Candidatus Aenigmarchaeota archaeon]
MKIDLHVHTKWSEDSINLPWLIMKMIKKRKLDGLAVTDHNSIRGWKSMQEAARRYGLQLILGEEIKVYHNGKLSGEVLGLFLNEEIRKGEPEEVIDHIRQQDGAAVIAHPFDRIKGFRNLDSFAGKIDAVEAFNARVFSMATNNMAFDFAEKTRLGCTGGSDAHIPIEVGLAYTVADCSDLEGFRKALKRRETRFFGRMVFPLTHFCGITILSLKKAGYF